MFWGLVCSHEKEGKETTEIELQKKYLCSRIVHCALNQGEVKTKKKVFGWS